jgi:transcription elongation factor GreB
MNKAFTKEDNESENEAPDDVDPTPIPGGKNYMTPAGAEKMRQELKHLRNVERPEVTKTVAWAAGNGDRSENGDYLYGKKRLREIDRRMRFLAKRLESAVIVDPLSVQSDQVLFGATVTIRYEDDSEKVYSIVGIDEIDVNHGRISWQSPLARCLMKSRAGDIVTFHSPKGPQDIEVMDVKYVPLE